MTTATAAELIARIRHNPELLESIRQQLNLEAGYDKYLPRKQYPNAERDAEIAAKIHAGTHTYGQIAIEYQLSLPRIGQIMATRPNPNPEEKVNPNAERDQTIAKRVWAGEARRDIAIEYQLSVGRVNQIMAQYPNPNPTRVNPNAERDRLILDDARKKVPRAEIARKHNLSVIRVNQIVGAAPKVKKLTRAEKTAEALRKYDAYADLTFEDECLIMLAKYDTIARRITQRIIEGANMPVLFDWEYPADCTGGDIKWTIEHYQAIAEMMYHFESGIWKL